MRKCSMQYENRCSIEEQTLRKAKTSVTSRHLIKMAVTFSGSGTASKDLTKFISEQFTAVFHKMAFIYMYKRKAMEETEFTKAETTAPEFCYRRRGALSWEMVIIGLQLGNIDSQQQ
ncbi:hypothetical protein U0070_006988 [Myodes glareolus]|uniref:Uncharacterized protein n=1 Tax=Myodes glareolus TaxID=447135 RepID=A0AAW0IBU8_MYOGA